MNSIVSESPWWMRSRKGECSRSVHSSQSKDVTGVDQYSPREC
jgi:hypothetical protein